MTVVDFLKIYLPLSCSAFSVLIMGIIFLVVFPPLGSLLLLLWIFMISSCLSLMAKSGYSAINGN